MAATPPPRRQKRASTTDLWLAVMFGTMAVGGVGTGVAGTIMYLDKKSKTSQNIESIVTNDVVRLGTTLKTETTSPFIGQTVFAQLKEAAGDEQYAIVFLPATQQSLSNATQFRVVKVTAPPSSTYLAKTLNADVSYVLEVYNDPVLGVGSKYNPSQNWEVFMGLPSSGTNEFYYVSPLGPTSIMTGPIEFAFAPTDTTNLYSAGPVSSPAGQITPFWPTNNETTVYDMRYYTATQSTGLKYPMHFDIVMNVDPSGNASSGSAGTKSGSKAGNSVPPNVHGDDPPGYINNKTSEYMMYFGYSFGAAFVVFMAAFIVRYKMKRRQGR